MTKAMKSGWDMAAGTRFYQAVAGNANGRFDNSVSWLHRRR
jgi:hypothetical protein